MFEGLGVVMTFVRRFVSGWRKGGGGKFSMPNFIRQRTRQGEGTMSIMTSFPTADMMAIRTYITRRKGIKLVAMMTVLWVGGNCEFVMCSNRGDLRGTVIATLDDGGKHQL